MTSVDDRLRQAASEIKRVAGSAELPDRAGASERRGSQVPGWAAALAAAVVLLVLIGGASWALRGGNPERVGEESITTEMVPLQLESLTWTRVVVEDAPVFEMGDITAGGPGFVAVGRDGIWVSPDGKDWAQVQEDGLGYPYLTEGSVVAGGPGLVAAGVHVSEDGPEVHATVWTSVDGFSWSRIPGEAETFAPDSGIRDVTVGGPGLVAVGWAPAPGEGMEVNPAVWTSRDGLSWSRVPHDEQVFGSAESLGAIGHDATRIHSVAAGGPGLVAVGMEGSDAAVWTSPDGFSWSRVPHDEAVFGTGSTEDEYQAMWHVAAGGPGVIAVGEEERVEGAATHAALWTSPDGFSWSRVPHDDDVFGFGEYRGDGKVIMRSIAAVDGGLVAVGRQGLFTSSDDGSLITDRAVVWTSSDGLTWSRTPADDDLFTWAEMNHVILEGNSLTVFGYGGPESWLPTVWETSSGSGVNVDD